MPKSASEKNSRIFMGFRLKEKSFKASNTNVLSLLDSGAAAPVGTDRRAVREGLFGAPSGRAPTRREDSLSPNAKGRWYKMQLPGGEVHECGASG